MSTIYKTVKDLKPGDKLYSRHYTAKTLDVVDVFCLPDTNIYHITIFCKGNTESQDVTTTWTAKGDSDTVNLFYVDPNYLIKKLEDQVEYDNKVINQIKLLQNENNLL
jgi:hypothetical protein